MTDATIVSRGPSPFVPGFELFDVKIPNGLTLRVASGGKEGKTRKERRRFSWCTGIRTTT